MMDRPAFFKFFLPEKSKTRLQIPIAFIQCIGGALPKKVFLRDRYNNLWPVKVAQVRKNWYFQDGWVKFVQDNMVTSCDFLVFEYFDDSLFDFKILGPSATEKKGAGAFLSKGMKEHEQVSEEEAEDEDDDDDDDDDDDSENGDYIFMRRQAQSEGNGDDDDETKDADYSSSQGNERKEDEVEKVNKASAATIGNSCRYQTSLIPKYYGLEIFRSGLAPLPKNPYFVVKIMPKRKGDLFIPLDLIKDHNLQLPDPVMLLVDPSGREFRGKYKKWKDGRVLYSGGWRRLCNLNFIEHEDVCICVFLQGDKGLYLNVSFVRANRVQH